MTGCGRHWCPEVFPLPIHSAGTVNVITFSLPSQASLCGLSFISPSIISTFTKDLLFLYCIPSLGTWCMIARVGSHRFYPREKQWRTSKPLWIHLNGRTGQNCFITLQIIPINQKPQHLHHFRVKNVNLRGNQPKTFWM